MLAVAGQVCRKWHCDVVHSSLWRRALVHVLWPINPSRCTRGVVGQLSALRRFGSHCRHLRVDCLRSEPGDLQAIVACCPTVEVLELSFFGPESATSNFVWANAWSKTLRRLSVCFWYDAILGSPRLADFLDFASTCRALEELRLSGLDWSRAKHETRTALRQQEHSSKTIWPSLRLLVLEGSEICSSADRASFAPLYARGVNVRVCQIGSVFASDD